MTKRKYPCAQPTLYAACVLAWQMCRDNQLMFFTHDNIYTSAFIIENIARIKAAEDLPDWEARKAALDLLSLEYDKVAGDLADMVKYLKKYIERAYKDEAVQKIMLKKAGFEYYSKVQTLDDKAILPFMSSASEFVAQNVAILTTAGKMPVAFPSEFKAIDVLFDDVLDRYNVTKQALTPQTDEKNDASNDVYDRTLVLLADGAFIYMKTPDLAKAYTFSAVLAQVKPTKNAGISGKVLYPLSKKGIAGITVTEPISGKTAITDKEGRYDIKSLSEDTYSLVFSGDGYVTQTVNDIPVKTGVTKRLNVEMVAMATGAG